jgi:hypothetical protein
LAKPVHSTSAISAARVFTFIFSRTLPLSVVKAKMKESWLLNDSCIVDLGNKKLQLTKEEKCDIIKNHLKKFIMVVYLKYIVKKKYHLFTKFKIVKIFTRFNIIFGP